MAGLHNLDALPGITHHGLATVICVSRVSGRPSLYSTGSATFISVHARIQIRIVSMNENCTFARARQALNPVLRLSLSKQLA